MRQDPEGFFNPCTVQVHNVTGAAVMTTVHKQLPDLEPGFMVPLPCFMCISLDWLERQVPQGHHGGGQCFC